MQKIIRHLFCQPHMARRIVVLILSVTIMGACVSVFDRIQFGTDPASVLNLGVAGALDERLHIGDIVIAESAVQHDVDTTALGDPAGMISGPNIVYIPCDEKAKEALLRAAQRQGLPSLTAVIATGDRFIEAQDEKHALRGTFGAAACDMEGGAIAQVCYENKTPYAAYRAVSDTLNGNGQEYAVNAAAAAGRGARLLRAFMEAL